MLSREDIPMEKGNSNRKNFYHLEVLSFQFFIVFILLATAQFSVSHHYVNPIFLAAPSQVFQSIFSSSDSMQIWINIGITLKEVFVGYTLSAVVGVTLGILCVTFPTLEKISMPFFSACMAVPKAAILPLLIVWFGIGFTSKVVLIVLWCVFIILFNTITGAKETKQEYLKVAKAFQATRSQIVFKILIPAALPSIFTGLRVTAATSITGVIFAEMTASRGGAGYLLNAAQAVLDTPRMFAVVIIMTIISVLFVSFVNSMEYLLTYKWK